MANDRSILTGEERAARALKATLHEMAVREPVRVDTTAWLARAREERLPGGRVGRRWVPAGIAAVIVVLVAATTVAVWPRWAATGPGATGSAAPSIPGSIGHFDNSTFSFDYPKTWRVLSGSYDEETLNQLYDVLVYGVLGTGDWSTGCRRTRTSGVCPGDDADVSNGRIVVKVSAVVSSPLGTCTAGPGPNVSLGPNAVRKDRIDVGVAAGGVIVWQIRQPGVQFDWDGTVEIQAWGAENPDRLAEVEALVASFRWAPGVRASAQWCAPTPTPSLTHYEAGGVSFDYPSSWRVLASSPGGAFFAVGTGTIDPGCTVQPDGSTQCVGPITPQGDEVVVVGFWYGGLSTPGPSVRSAPTPTGFTMTVAGKSAVMTYAVGRTAWHLGDGSYIEARWGPDATEGEAQARALVASLTLTDP